MERPLSLTFAVPEAGIAVTYPAFLVLAGDIGIPAMLLPPIVWIILRRRRVLLSISFRSFIDRRLRGFVEGFHTVEDFCRFRRSGTAALDWGERELLDAADHQGVTGPTVSPP